MRGSVYALLIDVMCGIGVATVFVPLVLYLFGQWATRRDRLLAYFDVPSLMLYYRQFYPASKPALATVQADFRKYFDRHYGRRHYVLPMLLLAVLAVAVAIGSALTLQSWQKVAPGQFVLQEVAVGALAGAFTWIINDLIDRLRRRDFTVSDVYNWVFRILIAAPFGWAFAQAVKPDIGTSLAFLLGAFPTATLFKIARRLAATKLGVAEDPDTGTLELEKLQSITKTNAERFYDEGISTIVQLAYADPVDLTIRTNFDFNYVIDCVSQALLWMYFEEKTHTLVIYSLRGAQEVTSLIKALRDPATQAEAIVILDRLGGALGLDSASVHRTLEEVANDPYTEFIYSVWH